MTETQEPEKPTFTAAPRKKNVSQERGVPLGYIIECGCGCGMHYEDIWDFHLHAAQEYVVSSAAEADAVMYDREKNEYTVDEAMDNELDEVADDEVFVSVHNREKFHLSHRCPYFPPFYKVVDEDEADAICCSWCHDHAEVRR